MEKLVALQNPMMDRDQGMEIRLLRFAAKQEKRMRSRSTPWRRKAEGCALPHRPPILPFGRPRIQTQRNRVLSTLFSTADRGREAAHERHHDDGEPTKVAIFR
jgi:hypothetical protein